MEHDLKATDLGHFTGSETWYRHALVRNILYTEGAAHVAEHGGAHWLLDKIATNQLQPELQHEEFQCWKLRLDESGPGANLTCDDGNGNIVYRERIRWTDFPLPEISLWFENRTIFLPSER
jgi:hypothetical protein